MMKIPGGRRLAVGAGVVLVLLTGIVATQALRHRAHSLQKGADLYYCPMHPTYTADRPGDCPICNMRLVKKETAASSPKEICVLHNCPMLQEGRLCPMLVISSAGEEVSCPVCGTHVSGGEGMAGMAQAEATPAGYAAVLLSPHRQQLIGVRTAPAQRRQMVKQIRAVGRVRVDETRIVHVHPKVEGWIDQIYARYEGDRVRKGEPLFSFYSPDFVTTQQEYLSTRRWVEEVPAGADPAIRQRAQENLESARQRLLGWDISEEQIQALEERGAAAKTLVLTSPLDGFVLRKHVFPGEYMERGADFYHVADLSTVWVDVQVYEADLPFVREGQEAQVTLPQQPDEPLQGKVVFLSPTLNEETRTATARLELPNLEGILRPGMFAAAQIRVDLGQRLAVPSEAVLETGARQILFVDRGQGVLEPREISAGVRAEGFVEIKSGVSEAEPVVVNGNFLVDSESRLKAALEPGHHHGP